MLSTRKGYWSSIWRLSTTNDKDVERASDNLYGEREISTNIGKELIITHILYTMCAGYDRKLEVVNEFHLHYHVNHPLIYL